MGSQLLGVVQENASILTGSFKGGDKNLCLSLCARFLGNSFFCHNIVSFNGEKLGKMKNISALSYASALLTLLALLIPLG